MTFRSKVLARISSYLEKKTLFLDILAISGGRFKISGPYKKAMTRRTEGRADGHPNSRGPQLWGLGLKIRDLTRTIFNLKHQSSSVLQIGEFKNHMVTQKLTEG